MTHVDVLLVANTSLHSNSEHVVMSDTVEQLFIASSEKCIYIMQVIQECNVTLNDEDYECVFVCVCACHLNCSGEEDLQAKAEDGEKGSG